MMKAYTFGVYLKKQTPIENLTCSKNRLFQSLTQFLGRFIVWNVECNERCTRPEQEESLPGSIRHTIDRF